METITINKHKAIFTGSIILALIIGFGIGAATGMHRGFEGKMQVRGRSMPRGMAGMPMLRGNSPEQGNVRYFKTVVVPNATNTQVEAQ